MNERSFGTIATEDERGLRWLKLQFIATVVLGVISAYHQVIPVLRDLLQRYYDLDLTRLGQLLSAGLIPSAAACALSGILCNRIGALRVLRISIIAYAAGALLAAIGHRWLVMLAGFGVMTASCNGLFIASQAYLTELFPARPRRVLAMFLSITAAAGIIFPIWTELLLSLDAHNPRITFANVLHIPFFVVAILMLLGLPLYRRSPRVTQQHLELEPPTLRLPRSAIAPLAVLIVIAGTDMMISLWTPRILASRSFSSMPPWIKPGYVMAGLGLAYVVSRAGLSFVPERLGRRVFLWLPSILGALILLAGVMSRNAVMSAAVLVLAPLVWSIQLPTVLGLLSSQHGRSFGWIVSLYMVGAAILGFIFTNAVGMIGEKIGEERLWLLFLLPVAGYMTAGLISMITLATGAMSCSRPPRDFNLQR